MAKQSGLGASVIVDDNGGVARTISNDVTNFEVSTPRGVQETTGVDKSAIERLLLLADCTVALTGIFNTAANMSHDVLKTVLSGSVNRTTAIGMPNATLTCEALYSSYQITRADSGTLVWSADGANADGALPVWS